MRRSSFSVTPACSFRLCRALSASASASSRARRDVSASFANDAFRALSSAISRSSASSVSWSRAFASSASSRACVSFFIMDARCACSMRWYSLSLSKRATSTSCAVRSVSKSRTACVYRSVCSSISASYACSFARAGVSISSMSCFRSVSSSRGCMICARASSNCACFSSRSPRHVSTCSL